MTSMQMATCGMRGARGRASRPRARVAGFTLIEVLIVVTVVGILAAIALPSYQEHVRKARRTQAQADLVEVAQIAERHHTVNNTYAGFNVPAALARSPRSGTAFYDIAVAVADGGGSFSLTATPIEGTAQAKDKCGRFTLDSVGRRYNAAGDSSCDFGGREPREPADETPAGGDGAG